MPARGLDGQPARRLEPAEQDILDEGRLPRTADAGHADEAVQGQPDVDPLEIVLGGAAHLEPGGRGIRRAGDAAGADHAFPQQVVRRERAARLAELRGRPEEDHLAAALPGTRAEVEDAVRRAHDPGVVLDHQQRVPGVAQPVQDADHPPDVAGVEPHARLVEDEEGVHERGAQRGRQVDALDLAAGERARLPIERQVAEADVDQVPEAGANLAQQQVRRLVERPGQRERAEEPPAARDREQRQLVQVELLAAESPEQGLRLQPRAVTGLAGAVGAVFREQHPDVHLVGLGLEPREVAAHAVPDILRPLPLAVDHPAALLVGQVAPRHVERDAAPFPEAHEVGLALARDAALPGADRAAAQRERLVRYHQAQVDADRPAEAPAARTRADRRIEGKETRGRVRVVPVAVGAVQVGREASRRPLAPVGQHRDESHLAAADPQRGLEGIDEAAAILRRQRHPVLDNLEQPLPRRPHPRVALTRQVPVDLLAGEIGGDRHRERHETAAGPAPQPDAARPRRAASPAIVSGVSRCTSRPQPPQKRPAARA